MWIQVPPFPKYTPPVVLRNLKSCVQVHDESLLPSDWLYSESITLSFTMSSLCYVQCNIQDSSMEICDIFQEHTRWHRPDAPLFLYRTMKWPLFLVSLNTLWILIAINLIWQDYLDLANLYTSRNIVELKRSLTTHEDVFKTVSFDLSFNILSVHHCLLRRW